MEAKARPSKKSRLRRLPKRHTGSGPAAPALGRTMQLVYSGLTAFSLRLTKELAAESTGNNLVFSPLSIYAALALMAAGARGRTLNELLDVLGARSRDELAEFVRGLAEQALADRSRTGGPRVMFACGVWHDKTRALNPAYRHTAVVSYKAETRAVDFHEKPAEAVKLINEWVAAATNNLIDSILDGASAQTDIILANAVYFKGKWETPFTKELTKDDRFYHLDGSAVDVPFMRSRIGKYIACHKGFKVLKLRYEQENGHAPAEPPSLFSMCIFLPDARDGLWSLVDRIASSPGFLRAHLPMNLVTVGDFRLPKFKLNFKCGHVTGVLRGLGLRVAFNSGEADLSGMVGDDGPLALDKVVHKAVIEVNEEGTEAAGVTAVHACGASAPKHRPVPVDFVADHPFAFFVVEEVSSAIVFAGHVLDPTMPGERLRGGEHDDLDHVGPAQSPAAKNDNVHGP